MKSRSLCFIGWLFISFCLNGQNQSAMGKVENPPPEVHFSWTGTCPGDTTCFINQSLLADTYTWTISTDTINPPLYTTNDTNFCYVFAAPGTYYVNLTAYNNHVVTVQDTIIIGGGTTADFTWVHCTNAFVNNSFCASSFHWDFGDGTTSTLTLPVHQYADTGHYNITLVASNGIQADTLTQNIFINALGYCNAIFTYTVSLDTVFVHALYYDGQTNYYWNFNDVTNTFATGRDTMHVYHDTVPTSHYVNLSTRNSCGFVFNYDTVYTDTTHFILPTPPDTNHLPPNLTFVSNLAVVPNPCTGGTINFFYDSYNEADHVVSIYDALGQKVYEASFSFKVGINGFTISSDGLAEGVYVLVLVSENTYARRKFEVIKH